MNKFVHLHNHSHYSLLDGLSKIEDLVKKTKALGMNAVALTDHGYMYGIIEFYKEAKKQGIKPIIGIETYVAPRKISDREPNIDDKKYHLVLLAKNNVGYKNLIKITTAANLEGFYYKPRVDRDVLRKYSEGVIALSACLSGEIPRAILSREFEKAEALMQEYKNIFGENFYLEISHHPNIKVADTVNKKLVEYSEKFGIPLAATCDSHYLEKDDAQAQDTLVAVQTGPKLGEGDRITMAQDDFSLKSPEEIYSTFPYPKSALENTQKIADMCNVQIELGKIQLPHYDVPEDQTADGFLKNLCMEGIEKRYGKATEEVIPRLEYELSVIKKTGYATYFLIVADFVNWAKGRGILVGPGRGSAAGSIVSYLTNITNIDPLKYDLLFERFLNPERVSMPDIDLDFADTRRDEVLDYVTEKYGQDHVSQIITFGTMAARAAVRDAGRALGIAYEYCDKLAKLIPFGSSLEEALENVAELKEMYGSEDEAKIIINAAKKLEGVSRHASTHACAVVISKDPLSETVPLQYATKYQDDTQKPDARKQIVTQFEMGAIENLGLLKMDFLGLKNLSIIERVLDMVMQRHGEKIDIDRLPLDDKKTFKLFQEAKTTGIFQLESAGMKRYLKELKPTEIEDIIAMVALYRPGPMELIPDFIARKHGLKKIEYLHPNLEPILKNTYGIGVYQEQMMRIGKDLAGFTLGEVDILRKAIGKKIKELLDEQEEKLVFSMIKNGIDEKTAKKIWELFPPFARYGFNRCLTGDTRIQNPQTGQLATIEQLYKKSVNFKQAISIDEHSLKQYDNCISDVIYNGKKPVFQLTTRSGRSIYTTANHPFYTSSGWQLLEDLQVGERVAVARELPEPKKPIAMPYHKLTLLGYLLSEGNLCHPHGFYYYAKNNDEIADYTKALLSFKNTEATTDHSKPTASIYSKRINPKKPSEAVEWVESIGIKWKKATSKNFPGFVFHLSKDDLAILIAKMFQGDGCINDKRDPQIFYATSSPDIARDMQHLLLRLNVLSTTHTKKFKYRGGTKIGYTITISRYNNISTFLNIITPHLVGAKQKTAQRILFEHPIINGWLKSWSARGSKDIVPSSLALQPLRTAALSAIGGFRQAERDFNIPQRFFHSDARKKGYLRETIVLLGEKLDNDELKKLGSSDIYWDEITSIAPAGIADTYDLTMKYDHNFIANDIFVHNSHAACYGMIGYQTAYLKAHFPAEFMASLMTSDLHDIERVAFLVEEAKSMNIKVLAPNINESFKDFTVISDTQIRFGLLAIKGVGSNISEAIINEREQNGKFKSFEDFLIRVSHKDLNKKTIEALIKSGALDEFEERSKLFSNVENILNFIKNTKEKDSPQIDLFSQAGIKNERILKFEPCDLIPQKQILAWEKELIGLYISGHPLSEYKEKFAKTTRIAHLTKNAVGKKFTLGGMVSSIKKIMTKKGDPMAFANLEDYSGKIELVIFPRALAKYRELWQDDKIVLVEGKLDFRDGAFKLICDSAKEII